MLNINGEVSTCFLKRIMKLNRGMLPVHLLQPSRQWIWMPFGIIAVTMISGGLSFQPPISSPATVTATATSRQQRGATWTSPVCPLQLSSSPLDVEKLIPEENPNVDPAKKSLSGVAYSHVVEGLSRVYPPEALEERNAASRTDGYWPFIQQGEDPPKQFTYGEFDLSFLAELLDRVHAYSREGHDSNDSNDNDGSSSAWNDKVFLDIGSGTGRLVLGAAALHPGWKLCRGIEILQTISNVAKTKLEDCREDDTHHDEILTEESNESTKGGEKEEDEEWVENEHGLLVKAENIDATLLDAQADSPTEDDQDKGATYSLPFGDSGKQRLPLAPVEFVCGSFDDPYTYFGDADCVFCFSSCMSPSILQSLSDSIGRQCRPGTIVITTDFPLLLEGTIPPFPDDESLQHGDYELELLEDGVDGYCWLTGGQSTAYIHRVKKSLWDGSGPRVKPELPTSEKAFRAIKATEDGRDDAAVRFLSGVRNNMFFAGFPERWLPDPASYQAKQQEDEGDLD